MAQKLNYVDEMCQLKFDVVGNLEHGGIGNIYAITGPLHRSGAIPSHFVFAFHRQRKFLFSFSYKILAAALRHHLPRFLLSRRMTSIADVNLQMLPP